MRFVPPPLRIGPTDGFEGTDLFGYRGFGERLANIVKALRGPSVIALDGAWGSGKSVFVRQWAGLLRKDEVPVVVFDAHKHDHDQDAFFAIASEVCAQAPECSDEQKKSLLASVGAVADTIGPILANVTLSLTTAGALKLKDFDPPDDSESPGFFERRIENARNYEDAVCRLRGELSKLATGLAPLVVVVDELDRCRPTFALSVLDRVKHLFGADRVCFVLVGDYSQLRRLVADRYGMSEDNAVKYLDKYSHLSFRLPATCPQRGLEDAEVTGVRYFTHLWNAVGLQDETTISNFYGRETWISGIHALIDVHQMSLRSVERLVTNLVLFYSATLNHGYPLALVIGLGLMRVLDPALYDRARTRRLTEAEIESFMRYADWKYGDFLVENYRARWTRAIAEMSGVGADGLPEMIRGRGGQYTYMPHDVVPVICRYMDQVAQDDRP